MSLGPPPAVVDLSRWAAWRYSGRLRPLLVAASPPRLVRTLPPSVASPGGLGRGCRASRWRHHRERQPRARDSRGQSPGTFVQFRGPAAAAGGAEACGRRGGHRSDRRQARRCAGPGRFESGRRDPRDSPRTVRSRGGTSTRGVGGGGRREGASSSARALRCLSPVAGLRAVVVLDAHSDSYQEERVPTWEAPVLAGERARRAGVPCLLVSACPTLELLAGRQLVTLSRDAERAGWAPIELIDVRDEDPHAARVPHPVGNVDPGRSRHRAGPTRPGGAQPQGSRPSTGLRALPKPASLRRLRYSSRSARTARARRVGGAALPEVRVLGPGGVRLMWADPAADRPARGRPGTRRPCRAHRSRGGGDRPCGHRAGRGPSRRARAGRDRGGAAPRDLGFARRVLGLRP